MAVANVKLYVQAEEGFVGTSLKRDAFVADCSDIDDIIVFRKDGKMSVTKVDAKTFVGKDIIYVAVFKKKDKRQVYKYAFADSNSWGQLTWRYRISDASTKQKYGQSFGESLRLIN